MSLPPGTRLGGFEISSLLGVGGMGEVYRATDTNLKRQVAIKVLPAAVAGDTDRLGRFEREAQVLAALNHPGIAAIYGLERRDGTMALVMELVEGPTLADRIAHGPIPVADALRIAKQIAEALEAAHEHGIVHRDLKPANVKVRPDGAVKILDFGLAKALASDPASAAAASATMSPTRLRPGFGVAGYDGVTEAGVILGTAAYMSPEQAAGKPVDARSDLWAFGVVLQEMLTGRQVFAGETVSHVLAAVLMQAPDLSALPADTPASIRKLLRRCLEKDRKNRLADASDARLEIDAALAGSPQDAMPASTSSSAPIAQPPVARTRTTLLAAFATGLLLAIAELVLLLRTRLATRALIGISSGGPAGAMTYTPLSFEPGGNTFPVWSPDGKGIAFAARQSEDEPYQVYVRYLDSSTSTQLTHADANARPIAWTTTGRIVFRSTVVPAGLWSVSQTGGQAERSSALTPSVRCRPPYRETAACSPITHNRTASTACGSARRPLVSKFDTAALGNAPLAWSPTTEWILSDRNGWRLLSPDGKTERDLAILARVCGFSRDGAEVYCVRLEGTRAVLFSRSLAGGPERVIAKLAPNQVPAAGLGPALRLTLTPDGRHVTFSASSRSSSLWLLNGIGTPR